MLETISYSSLCPLYLTTDTGIGSTLVVFSHNQVCFHLSLEYHSDMELKCVQLFIAPRNLCFLISLIRTMRSVRYSSLCGISLHPKDLSDVSTTKAECTCRFSPCGKYFAYTISYLVGDHIPIYTDCLCLIGTRK
jgi:hypothetical protein